MKFLHLVEKKLCNDPLPFLLTFEASVRNSVQFYSVTNPRLKNYFQCFKFIPEILFMVLQVITTFHELLTFKWLNICLPSLNIPRMYQRKNVFIGTLDSLQYN